jgi:membrane protease YdiL (CAAX protease family)
VKAFFMKLLEAATADPVAAIREVLFAIAAILSVALIYAIAAGCLRPSAARFEDALFAAAISTTGLTLVRLAARPDKSQQQHRRTKPVTYTGFWLISFALCFAAVSVSALMQRIPEKIETVFWKAAVR